MTTTLSENNRTLLENFLELCDDYIDVDGEVGTYSDDFPPVIRYKKGCIVLSSNHGNVPDYKFQVACSSYVINEPEITRLGSAIDVMYERISTKRKHKEVVSAALSKLTQEERYALGV